jgi:hypothetical protein
MTARMGFFYPTGLRAHFIRAARVGFMSLPGDMMTAKRVYCMCQRVPVVIYSDPRVALFDYLEVWYNRQRLHLALDYTCPATFERKQVLPFS